MPYDFSQFARRSSSAAGDEESVISTPDRRKAGRSSWDDESANFLSSFRDVNDHVQQLQSALQDLSCTYEDSLGASTSEQVRTLRADLEATVKDIKTAAQKLCNRVRALRLGVRDAEHNVDILHKKRDKTLQLEKQLIEIRGQVYLLQSRMNSDRVKEYRSKLTAVLGTPPSDTLIEEWASSRDDSAVLLQVPEHQRVELRRNMSELRERHRAIGSLQLNLHDLYQQVQEVIECTQAHKEHVDRRLKVLGDAGAVYEVKTVRDLQEEELEHLQRRQLVIVTCIAMAIASAVGVLVAVFRP